MTPQEPSERPWSFELLRSAEPTSAGHGSELERPERELPRAERELARAERELEQVHRLEFAALLRSATALRCRGQAVGGFLARPAGPPSSVRGWRRDVEAALELAHKDGFAIPGQGLLEGLRARAVARWPGALRIAQAAVSVDDGERSRLTLGYALLAAGEPARAARVFTRLLRELPRPRVVAAVLEGLGAAHADLGRPRLALGALDQAADDPNASLVALVSALLLALLVGDPARAGRAAARLELLVDARSPELAAALARLCTWMSIYGEGLPWSPRNSCESVFRSLLLARGSPAGRVCRRLVR